MRARPPLLLSRPTRLAALNRGNARLALAVLVLLLAACLTALGSTPPATTGDRSRNQADIVLYQQIVDGVRHGGTYYSVAATALRENGYPLRPFVAFRLPTLAMVQAHLPWPVVLALLYALAAAVLLAWFARLRPAFARPPALVAAMLLLAGGMAVFVQGDLAYFHELWAGPLIALSLALRRPGRWIEAVCAGLMAMLIRETAALYVGLMLLFALFEGERREAIGWGAALVIFGIVLGLHAQAVAAVVEPLDPTSQGWHGLLGFGFFVRTMTLSTALLMLPLSLGALLIGLALFGWAAWDTPLALRALTIFVAYAALIGVFGRADTFYWGLMIAPILLVGLAFAPDGIRDLFTRALDRRRITVTRSVK